MLRSPFANDARSPRESTAGMEALADDALALRCAEGNETAWAVLVRRYRRLVYAIPHRAGLGDDDAEEIFATTFARLAERVRTMREPGRVRAWLVTTARRLTIDAIRERRDAREILVDDETIAEIADPREPPSAELERLETRHLVRLALSRLPSPCRSLLSALYPSRADGPPSYESIAADLGVPIGSIGPTRARCLQKLLKEYRALEGEGT